MDQWKCLLINYVKFLFLTTYFLLVKKTTKLHLKGRLMHVNVGIKEKFGAGSYTSLHEERQITIENAKRPLMDMHTLCESVLLQMSRILPKY